MRTNEGQIATSSTCAGWSVGQMLQAAYVSLSHLLGHAVTLDSFETCDDQTFVMVFGSDQGAEFDLVVSETPAGLEVGQLYGDHLTTVAEHLTVDQLCSSVATLLGATATSLRALIERRRG